MQFIKVGNQYINMAQVHQVDENESLGGNTLYVYTSDHTIRITEPEERAAVLAWLGRNSINVVARREL